VGYVKLDSGILESSVWAEDSDTLRVWIYLLAKADSIGVVYATMPGIAVQCGLSLAKIREVLDKFSEPDSDSRNPDKDGRRIAIRRKPEFCIEVLNHARYRAKSLTHAERQARYRDSHRDESGDEKSRTGDTKSRKVTQGRRQKTEGRNYRDKTKTSRPAGADFDSWYEAYPKHEARNDAERAWGKLTDAEQVECVRRSPAWNAAKVGTERKFLPMPATYLNGRRWRDDVTPQVASGRSAKLSSEGSSHARDRATAESGACPRCGGPNPEKWTVCKACLADMGALEPEASNV
jgi:hypothetical protein